MKIFKPKQCIGNQKVLHFILTVIEYLCSPVRMFSLLRICIFKCRCSVKVCKSMCISWEMCRNPVKNHSDFVLMKIINHICKIFRCSVARSRRIIACYLISPGTVKRMLCNPNQLNVSIAHLFHILCNLTGKLSVIIESLIFRSRSSPPGTDMYFIDGNRSLILVPCLTILHPCIISPF